MVTSVGDINIKVVKGHTYTYIYFYHVIRRNILLHVRSTLQTAVQRCCVSVKPKERFPQLPFPTPDMQLHHEQGPGEVNKRNKSKQIGRMFRFQFDVRMPYAIYLLFTVHSSNCVCWFAYFMVRHLYGLFDINRRSCFVQEKIWDWHCWHLVEKPMVT